jgi:hypothetical protein
MRVVGIILVLCGLTAFVMGGLPYNKTETVGQVGSMKMSVTQKKSFPVPPLASGAAVAVGALLIYVGRRRGA